MACHEVQYLARNYFMNINNLCNVTSKLKCVLFADHTKTFYSADTLELFSNIISQEMTKLHSRLAVN